MARKKAAKKRATKKKPKEKKVSRSAQLQQMKIPPEVLEFAAVFQDRLMEHGLVGTPVECLEAAVCGFIRQGELGHRGGRVIHLKGSYGMATACGVYIYEDKYNRPLYRTDKVTCPKCKRTARYQHGLKEVEAHKERQKRERARLAAEKEQLRQRVANMSADELTEALWSANKKGKK